MIRSVRGDASNLDIATSSRRSIYFTNWYHCINPGHDIFNQLDLPDIANEFPLLWDESSTTNAQIGQEIWDCLLSSNCILTTSTNNSINLSPASQNQDQLSSNIISPDPIRVTYLIVFSDVNRNSLPVPLHLNSLRITNLCNEDKINEFARIEFYLSKVYKKVDV